MRVRERSFPKIFRGKFSAPTLVNVASVRRKGHRCESLVGKLGIPPQTFQIFFSPNLFPSFFNIWLIDFGLCDFFISAAFNFYIRCVRNKTIGKLKFFYALLVSLELCNILMSFFQEMRKIYSLSRCILFSMWIQNMIDATSPTNFARLKFIFDPSHFAEMFPKFANQHFQVQTINLMCILSFI